VKLAPTASSTLDPISQKWSFGFGFAGWPFQHGPFGGLGEQPNILESQSEETTDLEAMMWESTD